MVNRIITRMARYPVDDSMTLAVKAVTSSSSFSSSGGFVSELSVESNG